MSSLPPKLFRFSARLIGGANGSEAMTVFTAGLVGPDTIILPLASTVLVAPTVQFSFASSGDVSFLCSLQPVGTASVYSACASPM